MINDELVRIAGENALNAENPMVAKLCKTVRYLDVQLNVILKDVVDEDTDRTEIIDYIYDIKDYAEDMLKSQITIK